MRYKKILCMACLCFATQFAVAQKNSPMNKAHEKQLFNNLYNTINIYADEETKVEWCNCVVEGYKTSFPNGIDQYSPDELKKRGEEIGQACTLKMYNENKGDVWTKALTAKVRDKLLADTKFLGLKETVQVKLVDCVLEKYKVKFKHGISDLRVEEMKAISNECAIYKNAVIPDAAEPSE